MSRLLVGFIMSAGVYGILRWIPHLMRASSANAIHSQRDCAAIADVSHRPLGEEDFSGEIKLTHDNGFSDHYLFDRPGKVKVGIRDEWGASIVYLGPADGRNMLDNSALGRGVQLSFHEDARAYQGCAFNESCEPGQPVCSEEELVGWNPTQAGDRCGQGSGVEVVNISPTLSATVTARHFNPGWRLKACTTPTTICADAALTKPKAQLRINEALRFVRPGVLEVEMLVTNLSDKKISATVGERHEMPVLFANAGKAGSPELGTLRDASGAVLGTDKRSPANIAQAQPITEGWVTYQNREGTQGIGIYWENRNDSVKIKKQKDGTNSLSSNFPFPLPAYDSIRTRFYLILGSFAEIKTLATNLDKSLPPFGRIETNRIEEDARTVNLQGWALDNKAVELLELWVDGKKVSEIPLNVTREDVCLAYPGYKMCQEKSMKVGFNTTYPRPSGTGCERPIEIRARDTDGNERVIARKSISPVL